jgi:hypothetical protein
MLLFFLASAPAQMTFILSYITLLLCFFVSDSAEDLNVPQSYREHQTLHRAQTRRCMFANMLAEALARRHYRGKCHPAHFNPGRKTKIIGKRRGRSCPSRE